MDTAKDNVVSASAAMTTAGAPARDLTPAEIDALAAAGNYAAISKPHLSPILGRYYERTGATARATPCTTRTDGASSTSPAASPRHRSDTTTRRSRRPSRTRPTSCSTSATPSATWSRSAGWPRCWPTPAPSRSTPSSSATRAPRPSRRPLKLARRVTGRPGIIAFRGAFHGRTFGAASITSSSINYRLGYEPLLPSVYLTPFPNVYRYFGGDEEQATAAAMGCAPDAARPRDPAEFRGRDHHRADTGRGRLQPGARCRSCGNCAPSATSTASC